MTHDQSGQRLAVLLARPNVRAYLCGVPEKRERRKQRRFKKERHDSKGVLRTSVICFPHIFAIYLYECALYKDDGWGSSTYSDGIHAFAMIGTHILYLLRLGRVDGWMHRNPLTDAHAQKWGNEKNSNICIHIYT